ncbi:MAG: SWIB/MDM2 domain-containing protein [Myxococcota bacterium]
MAATKTTGKTTGGAGTKADAPKAEKSTAAKGSAKAGKAAADTGGEGKVRGGLAQTVTPDKALAAVIGAEPGTRADITKRIWEYVRNNKLQDTKDKRVINADAKLKPVFGGKESVTMFEMTKLVNQHVG